MNYTNECWAIVQTFYRLKPMIFFTDPPAKAGGNRVCYLPPPSCRDDLWSNFSGPGKIASTFFKL